MLIADSSAWLALFNRKDPDRARAGKVFYTEAEIYVPVAILAEVCCLIQARLGQRARLSFLRNLERGAFRLDFSPADLTRVRELVEQYTDLPVGFSDAAVIALAERLATLDHRLFRVVRANVNLELLP